MVDYKIYNSSTRGKSIQYGYIIEAAILYYPIRNGWKLWYGKKSLFYYKAIQDWQSYDLQNLGLKIHNFSLELKQSKTPPAASCWIISTLVRRCVFFNPRCCKSWDCPNPPTFRSFDFYNLDWILEGKDNFRHFEIYSSICSYTLISLISVEVGINVEGGFFGKN